jgi:pimeloyl-ACP methyl ester carboxylesterase
VQVAFSLRTAGAGIAAALVAATVVGCRAPAATGEGAPLAQQPCVNISAQDARCYRLTVPENRAARGGRTLGLRIVVLPATGGSRADDAVIVLAGGPGQAATDFIDEPALVQRELGKRRDLVFADQRGTGGSNELTCEFYGPPDKLQTYFDAFLPLEKVRHCRTALERKADLAQYTTATSVEDLEAIRVALGYQTLNLIGTSYGTRLAMEYVRRYEPRVRSVVLEGPVTPRTHAPERFGQLAAAALDALLDECRVSTSCNQAFPELREQTRVIFERLGRGPVTASVAHPAARQTPSEIALTRDHVAEAIRYMMYSSAGASHVPLFLHEAFAGNYAPIASFLLRWRSRGTFDGLYLSITCAEDVPLVSPDAAERDEPTFLGGYRVRQQRDACAAWPRGSGPANHTTPVTASVPTLIVSGMLDPVTPPSNGDEIARTLANALHVRVPFGGHSPAGLSGLECLSDLKRQFIDAGRIDGLDAGCVGRMSRPAFSTGR